MKAQDDLADAREESDKLKDKIQRGTESDPTFESKLQARDYAFLKCTEQGNHPVMGFGFTLYCIADTSVPWWIDFDTGKGNLRDPNLRWIH